MPEVSNHNSTVLKEFQRTQEITVKKGTNYAPFVPQATFPSSYEPSEVDVGIEKAPDQCLMIMDPKRQGVRKVLERSSIPSQGIVHKLVAKD